MFGKQPPSESTPGLSRLDVPQDVSGLAQIFLLDLEIASRHFEQALPFLNLQERQYLERFRHSADQRRFALSRACLKQLLGPHLDIAPEAVRLQYTSRGKPELAPGSGAGKVHFNVSHASRYALLAISGQGPLGIDIEQQNHNRPLDALALQLLSPDEHARHTLPLSAPDFYRYWTAKEAICKALGWGIGEHLVHFSITPAPTASARIQVSHLGQPLEACGLWPLAVPAGYAAALCLWRGPLLPAPAL